MKNSLRTINFKKDEMSDLSQKKWVNQLSKDDNAVIVDVRTTEERAEGFVENSIHMDIYQPQDFMNSLESLDKSKKLLHLLSFWKAFRSGLCCF